MVYIDRRRYNIFNGSTFTKPVAGSSQATSQPPETDRGDKMDQAFPLCFCILQVIKNWTVGRPGSEVLVITLNVDGGGKKRVFFLTS